MEVKPVGKGVVSRLAELEAQPGILETEQPVKSKARRDKPAGQGVSYGHILLHQLVL